MLRPVTSHHDGRAASRAYHNPQPHRPAPRTTQGLPGTINLYTLPHNSDSRLTPPRPQPLTHDDAAHGASAPHTRPRTSASAVARSHPVIHTDSTAFACNVPRSYCLCMQRTDPHSYIACKPHRATLFTYISTRPCLAHPFTNDKSCILALFSCVRCVAFILFSFLDL